MKDSMTHPDGKVRGGVYLCQAGPCLSCGACCGLYNIRDLSRPRLLALLSERTRLFAAVPRTIAAIDRFERERSAVEGVNPPIADFHHCVFVGLIRDEGERVGCLLHPLASGNAGVDWRGMSHYGGAACKNFFCPSYDLLAPRWKRILRAALDDWFEYGLIVIEHRLVAALLAQVEARLGQTLEPDAMTESSLTALGHLLRLRLGWPFHDPARPLAWNFFSTRQTERPDSPDQAPPDLRPILRELETLPSHFPLAIERLNAEIDATVRILARPE